jgi:ABC-type polysaccharide/polyol phosphate export permease
MFDATVNVWRWRRLVVAVARRELKSRYVGSALGAAWTVLEPAVQFGLYLTVFSYFLGMRLESNSTVGSFGFFLLGGMIPFGAFQEALVRALGLARSQAGLVRHINAPLEVLLAGSLAAIFARHAVALALAMALAALWGTVAWAALPWLLLGLVLLCVGTWGLALLLVPAGAFLPDLTQVVGSTLMVLFFLTPVVYPLDRVPAPAARWLALNPLIGLLDTFRAVLVGGHVAPGRVAVTAAAALLLVVVGSVVFAKRAAAVPDVI